MEYINKPTLIDYNNPATFMSTLNVSGKTVLKNDTTINGILSLKNDIWHKSANDNIYRLYCASGSTTFLTSGGIATDNNFIVYSSALSGGYNVNLGILNNGNTTIRGTVVLLIVVQ